MAVLKSVATRVSHVEIPENSLSWPPWIRPVPFGKCLHTFSGERLSLSSGCWMCFLMVLFSVRSAFLSAALSQSPLTVDVVDGTVPSEGHKQE